MKILKIFSTILAIFLFAVCFIGNGNASRINASTGTEANLNFRYVQNNAFGFGERLDYKVKYSFVVAGEGYFHILPNPIYRGNNRECFDIRFQVNSLKSLEWMYRVRDQYRTALDVSGIFPWEFEQTIREGKYKKDYKAIFDQSRNLAYVNKKSYKIPNYVHDIVSAFFYARTLDLSSMRKDTVFYLQNFFDNEVNKLGIKIGGREIVETEAGKFRCIIVEPIIIKGGLFKSEASIFIYLTDDERKIPIRVSTKILIGYVSADLVSYKGVRGAVKARLK